MNCQELDQVFLHGSTGVLGSHRGYEGNEPQQIARQSAAPGSEHQQVAPGFIISGVGQDAPLTINPAGGKQSAVPARMELCDPRAILKLGETLMEGSKKYTRDNWRKIPVESHINKAIIHLYSYLAGDTSDDHLGHAQCRVHMAVATHLSGGLEREEDLNDAL